MKTTMTTTRSKERRRNVSLGFYTYITALVVLSRTTQVTAFSFPSGTTPSSTRSGSIKQARASPLVLFSDTSDDDNIAELIKDSKFIERNKKWVVLVDDEESIRMAVGDYLYDQGYKISACADANSLVALISSGPSEEELPIIPDAIISDIRMPGRDGLALLKFIRSNPRLERVPVILLTAKALTRDRIEGYNAGADVYLPKPFDPEELLAIVDNAIRRRQEMTGGDGRLSDIQQEMENIKYILKRNSAKVIKKTSISPSAVEREILDLLGEGLTNQEIADRRGASLGRTTKVMKELYAKTQTRNRTELLRWAMDTGYISKRRK